jgi:beta-mannosidase|eukprot:COSAG06_NODE_2105_length_7546_cov_10.050575_3_plen_342_part_00
MDAPGPRRAAPERLRLMSAAAALVTLLLPPVASVAGSATAASTISLDGTWALSSDAGHRLKGVVPGDLITDLENARIVQDPLYELGWLNNNTNLAPPWTAHVWTYSTTFTAPPSSLLVFGGIKMCAQILVNGKPALFATDQFLRYTLPVPAGDVKLEVVFDPTKDVGGRYMASSGGWDFEPYTNTREGNISARNFSIPRTFSRGIWQSVTVQTGLAVLHVVPEIFYTGEYATARLADGATNFTVNVTVHVHSHAATTLDATVSVAGSSKALSKVAVPAGESALSMTLDVDGPALWWPQGHGAQILHSLNVTLQPATGQPVHASRSVGFRTLALVTGNDTDA